MTRIISPNGARVGRPWASSRWLRSSALTAARAGEFEAFLREVDKDLLARIQNEVGRGGKPVVASLFVAEHPEPPEEVLDMYRKIARWFGPTIVPEEEASDEVQSQHPPDLAVTSLLGR